MLLICGSNDMLLESVIPTCLAVSTVSKMCPFKVYLYLSEVRDLVILRELHLLGWNYMSHVFSSELNGQGHFGERCCRFGRE